MDLIKCTEHPKERANETRSMGNWDYFTLLIGVILLHL